MIRQFSAGGVVFKDDKVMLIQSSRTKRIEDDSPHYWVFPKGWLNEGEKSEQAALREVEEEAGVKAEIVCKLGSYQYFFNTSKGERVFKTVTFYLMNYLSGDPADHDWEVMDAKWFDAHKALEMLSFRDDKNLLEQALQIREGQSLNGQ